MSDGIPIGDLNDIRLILGIRGMGKSTYCIDAAMGLAHETGGYMLGHSLGARFPATLPDGVKPPIQYHKTIEQLDRHLRLRPDCLHVLVGGDGNIMIRYARELSRELRKKAWYRVNGWWRLLLKPWSDVDDMTGIVCRPVILIIDEGAAMDMNLGKVSSKNPETKEFKQAIYGARHEHIAYMFQIQDANAIGPALQTQASRYIVFNLSHQWQFNAVMAAGATPRDIDEIKTLQVGEFIEFGPAVPRAPVPVQPVETTQEKDRDKPSQ